MSNLTRRPGRGGGGPPLGSVGDSLNPARQLRKIDMYRKVPRDLTEGSAVGGLVSAVAVVALLVITFLELRAVTQTRRDTEVVVDRGENELFRINLNVTLPGLSCEFASVNVRNSLGARRDDVADSTLHKFSLDAKSTYVGSATKLEDPVQEHTYGGTNVDHYGNARHALELDPSTFETALLDYEVLLVDFHSPRCIHCVKFAPIFEHAADLVQQRAPPRRDQRKKKSVALATVDCVQHLELCRAQKIQAYPTVLVFRTPSKNPLDVKQEEQQYEAYLGAREAEAISAFALKVLNDVLTADPALGKDAFSRGTDSTGDGRPESVVFKSKGCRIEGFLDVRRVPGTVVIRPHSRDQGHEFDTGLIDMGHKIEHLSFGRHGSAVPAESDDGPYSRRAGRPAVVRPGADDPAGWFRGKEPSFAHVHSVKVVSRTEVPLAGDPITAFQYSVASDQFKAGDNVPFVEIDYDLSPLEIRVVERKRGVIEGVVGVLAVVGGVYSASFIVEAALSWAVGRAVDVAKVA